MPSTEGPNFEDNSLDSPCISLEFREGEGTYRVGFDVPTPSVAETVISAVAHADDRDPLALPPLYWSIDPDALDSLFRPGSANPTTAVTFDYAGYSVTVDSQGFVELAPVDGRD